MRTFLVLLTGFWIVVGMIMSPIAYALAAACVVLLGADILMRLQNARINRLDRRLGRWCNPAPLPATRQRSSAVQPRSMASNKPGRQTPIRLVETKPEIGKTPGRSSGIGQKAESGSATRQSRRGAAGSKSGVAGSKPSQRRGS